MKHPFAPAGIVFAAFFLAAIFIVAWYVPSMNDTKRIITLDIKGNAISAEIAETDFELSQGLSHRDSIAANEGMLFLFPSAGMHTIWMKDMEFPIDILWIKNGAIVDLEERVKTEPGMPASSLTRYVPDVAADLVLELPADFSRVHNIMIGDNVFIRAGALPAKYRGVLLAK